MVEENEENGDVPIIFTRDYTHVDALKDLKDVLERLNDIKEAVTSMIQFHEEGVPE